MTATLLTGPDQKEGLSDASRHSRPGCTVDGFAGGAVGVRPRGRLAPALMIETHRSNAG